MKNFRFTADAIITAEDLDEVFYLLAEHFLKMLAGQIEEEIFFLGKMDIQPMADEDIKQENKA